MSLLSQARMTFHQRLLATILTADDRGIPSNADGSNKASCAIASELASRLGKLEKAARPAGQTLGNIFEQEVASFIGKLWPQLQHLRPGDWFVGQSSDPKLGVAAFDQFNHLEELRQVAEEYPRIKSTIGSDYLIRPDIVVVKHPLPDERINLNVGLVDEHSARLTPLRKSNAALPTLHANISCKWTIRSDRSQNARSEGLNLVRNRKGKLPHVCVVTAEPMPSRIASIALGTGDIDCVYHIALDELSGAVEALDIHDATDMLATLVSGKRLRDISDLPMDLVV